MSSDLTKIIDECIEITLADIQQCRENVIGFKSCSFMDCRHLATFANQSIRISQHQLKILSDLRKNHEHTNSNL